MPTYTGTECETRYVFNKEEFENLHDLLIVLGHLQAMKRACKSDPTFLDEDIYMIQNQISQLIQKAQEFLTEVED